MTGKAQKGGGGIPPMHSPPGTRRRWWSAPHSDCFTPGKNPVPIFQAAGWGLEPVWMAQKISFPPGFDPRTVQAVVNHYIPAATGLT